MSEYEDYDNDVEDKDYDYYEDQEVIPERKDQTKWFTTSEIYKTIKQLVRKVDENTCLGYDGTLLLLRHFQWNQQLLLEKYFYQPEQYRIDAGIMVQPNEEAAPQQAQAQPGTVQGRLCEVCLQAKPQFDRLTCNQEICTDCWREYLQHKIKTNEVFPHCPYSEKCRLVVPYSFLKKYMTKALKQQYRRWLGKKYAAESRTMKTCPAPNCDFACENEEFYLVRDQKCKCGTVFCFKCLRESHRPCDCKRVTEWEQKNNSEGENLTWIRLYTKLCPNDKCRKPIEKNQGCNHMVCRKPMGCGMEFCWMCLGPWKEHCEATGGFYRCNRFESQSNEEKEKASKNFDKEKSSLEKYSFYFERYNNNHKAQHKAREDKKKIEDVITELHKKFKTDSQEVQFLNLAVDFLITARRVLKYTYCYGFYIDNPIEKQAFEFHQGHYEQVCEQLHSLIENTRFDQFTHKSELEAVKQPIVNLYTATQKHMDTVLAAIENGELIIQK